MSYRSSLHDEGERRASGGGGSEPGWNRELDTRNKIKPLKDLNSVLVDSKWIAIAGFFDPLTSIQASRLAEIAKKGHNVLAIVLTAPDCLLPSDARAALVAAVREVS